MRVLIAEDDDGTRLKLEFTLRKWGFEVTAVSDGKQAVTALKMEDPPPLAILDWHMPRLTGLEVIQKVRLTPREVPTYFLLLTASADKEDIVRGLEAGANDYLTKPFDWRELRARIDVGRKFQELNQELAGRVKQAQEALNTVEYLHSCLKEANEQLQESNVKLQDLSTTDALTGIANRRKFEEVLDAEWRRAFRSGSPLTLIMIDIDSFKTFNDSYGHLEGDTCLKRVAAALQKHVQRAGDLVARYGGEEFVVLLPSRSASESSIHAEFLRSAVEELAIPHSGNGSNNVVTISLGVASIVPLEHLLTTDLIRLADRTLYSAKRAGRNRAMIGHEQSAMESRETEDL